MARQYAPRLRGRSFFAAAIFALSSHVQIEAASAEEYFDADAVYTDPETERSPLEEELAVYEQEEFSAESEELFEEDTVLEPSPADEVYCEPPAVAEQYTEEQLDENTIKRTWVSHSYDYLITTTEIIKDVAIAPDRRAEKSYVVIDQMWNYETCAWEKTTKWEEVHSLATGFVLNLYLNTVEHYESKAFYWEDAAWRQSFHAKSGRQNTTRKNALTGAWEAYVDTHYSDDEKHGVEADIDRTQLDAKGRPMYRVKSFFGDRFFIRHVSHDEMPPEPQEDESMLAATE